MTKLTLRRARREAGLCVQCGLPAEGSYRFCKPHRRKHNAAQAKGQRRRNADRMAAGLCMVAGCRLVRDTSRYCRKHQDHYNEWKRRRRAEGRYA